MMTTWAATETRNVRLRRRIGLSVRKRSEKRASAGSSFRSGGEEGPDESATPLMLAILSPHWLSSARGAGPSCLLFQTPSVLWGFRFQHRGVAWAALEQGPGQTA